MRTDPLLELVWGLTEADGAMGLRSSGLDPKGGSSPIFPDDALGIMSGRLPTSSERRAGARHRVWLAAWRTLRAETRAVLLAVHGPGPRGPELPGLGNLTPLLRAVLPTKRERPPKDETMQEVRSLYARAVRAWSVAWRTARYAADEPRRELLRSLPR